VTGGAADVDWVSAVGYQKEVLHTGAVRHLLRSPRGAEVARGLTGDASISAVVNPRAEVKLHRGGRRPVDLAADLRFAAGHSGRLGIEVKVDSAWSPGQLTETVPEDCHGVLLAVGLTSLAVDDRDLGHLKGYRWPWRRVGPRDLAELVGEHADGDRELLAYAEHLRGEADAHDQALQAVRDGRIVEAGRDPRLLAHWAYFAEVLRHRSDSYEWERTTLISGPLVTLWTDERSDGCGDYLEFMGEGDTRSLCVKTYAPSGALHASRARVCDRLTGLQRHDTKQPGASSKTCTAARFPLHDRTPAEAAALVDTLLVRLAG